MSDTGPSQISRLLNTHGCMPGASSLKKSGDQGTTPVSDAAPRGEESAFTAQHGASGPLTFPCLSK